MKHLDGLVFAAVALACATPARADYYIDGGADSTVIPAVMAEMQVVYAGQHFTPTPVSSAAVQDGFLQNDCTFGVLQDCSWSPLGASTPIDFGVSLIPLTEAQVAAYNAGLGQTSGPLLQFPLYALPIAIVAQEAGITQNGQLVLDDGALCGILSGQLTDWSQFSNTVPPGGFKFIYDSVPGSGATWLLTQHLNAVCNTTNSTFTTLPVPITGDFSTLPVPGGVANNPRFIAASGSAAEQTALLSSNSAIGYLGPSYTSIAPASPVTSSLVVAALVNAISLHVAQPTISATNQALRSPGPGAVNTLPPSTKTQASDPTNWVPLNPMPAQGYPIVGFASWILSTCYATVGRIMVQYLTAPYNPTMHAAIIMNNGFAVLGNTNGAYQRAVNRDLLKNISGFGINMQNPLNCLAYHGR